MNHSSLVHNTAIPEHLSIPQAMGLPSSGQATGTILEVLAETAGRVCYDSYGKGRSSKDFHNHILEVGHLSVYEHCTFVIQFDEWHNTFSEALLNRPGIFFRRDVIEGRRVVRLTVNARAALEFDRLTTGSPVTPLRNELMRHAHSLMPQVIKPPRGVQPMISNLVTPNDVNEVWISMWLKGSRGFSHEMVRHGDWTAISQRSTRYVDESESPNCWHPEITRYIDEEFEKDEYMQAILHDVEGTTQDAYDNIVKLLTDLGRDRKTARGAARGVLPNALETQMIFSASLRQWMHIFSLRCSPFADGEIREIMREAKSQMLTDRLSSYVKDND